ncbi:hypothetical protein [Fodinibius sp. Rm-B-1B1-1]|uniref:hypothetical protein n=1 Tax=Fodinibius alkaliphilus TaxID=3140241 RepID=UPI003159DD40
MRLDKLIEQRKKQKLNEQPDNLVIYDLEAPGKPKPPKDATNVVIMLPDNGRDQ